jgi:aldose 1-epimerase
VTETIPTPYSGERFVLERGRVRIEVGAVAAVLCEVRVDGERLTETVPVDALPPQGCGIVLAPWPNRVRGGLWNRDGRWTPGRELQLDQTEPATGNATHGLLRNAAYQLAERTDSELVLEALIPPQNGWPFPLATRVRYRLLDDGVEVVHEVTNLGAAPAPWAVGAHPYLRVGETPIEQLTLMATGRTELTVDDALIPIGEAAVDGTSHDLRGGALVGADDLNAAFGDLTRGPDGVVAWLEAPDGARTVLRVDEDFRWLQLYTPRDHPRADGKGLAVAIEPMTAPPDALNSGRDLIELAPGQSWSGWWSLRREGAGTGAA